MADHERGLPDSKVLFARAGATGALVAERDWAATPLGPIESWSPSLVTTVATLLHSAVPMTLLWGADGIAIYNEGCAEMFGDRHPDALGRPIAAGWPEAAEFHAQVLKTTLAGGKVAFRGQPLRLARDGRVEQVWMDFDCSPWFDDDGVPTGAIGILTDVTATTLARRSAEEERSRLEVSEARFRGIFDSDLIGLTIFDSTSGETLMINDCFLRMTGHTRADVDDGRWDWRKFTVERWLPRDEAAIAQAQARGWWEPFEKEYRHRDGHIFPVRLSSAPMPDWPGCVVVSIEDITARRAAETARDESVAEFRELADAMPQLVWTAAADGTVDYYNARQSEYAGIRRKDESSYDWAPVIHPDDIARTQQAWADATQHGEPYTCEHRLVCADGSFRWHVSRAQPRFDAEGRVSKWYGTATDIDALKSTQAALEELNHRLEERVESALAERKLFADVVQGTDAVMLVLDADYHVLALNAACIEKFETLFGVRLNVGDDLLARLEHAPEQRAQMAEFWRRALDGEEFTEMHELGDPARGRRSYEVTFNTLRNRDGRQIGAYEFATEVTARLAEQARLAEAEAALLQSQKMESLGQLTGGVAHDFNNLLTPIIGVLDLLAKKHAGDARAARLVAGAMQAADRARSLVQRLLAFSRRQTVAPRAVDGRALIGGMVDLIARSLGPDIELDVRLADDPPPLLIDPNLFELALLNLAVNARDAMPDGGKLEVTMQADTPPDTLGLSPETMIRVCVSDTGSGMTPEVLARAMDPFFTTKGAGRGTGLGLSMVHGLAVQSGGALTLASTPGEGTTAVLWLPVSDTLPDAPAVPLHPAAAVVGRGEATVLLVDDEELVRQGTAEMLRESGYTVLDVASPLRARQLLRDGLRPDALVTDFAMPGMNGVELIAALREMMPALPALLITGFADAGAEAEGLARLAKPFRQAELELALDALLAGAH